MSEPSLKLLQRIATHAADRPSEIAYREASGGQTLTWRELADGVQAFARTLRSILPQPGVVLLSAPNQIQYPIAFLGTLAAGCDVFPLSAEIADAELLRAAEQSSAIGLIGHERTCKLLTDRMPTWKIGDVTPSPGKAGDGRGEDGAAEREAKPALLLQSSGTTGLPKIVRRSGRSLDAVSAAMAAAIGFTMRDHVLAAVPLTHSYGLEHGLLAPVWAGSTVHLVRGLDVPTVLSELAGNQITIFPGVPAMFEMLAGVSDAPPIASLCTAYSAGAPLPDTVIGRFAERFGVRVAQLYGATEVGSVTFNNPHETPFAPDSVGKPMAGVEIRILHVTHNTPVPAGEEGHVAILAESMLDGYLHDRVELIAGFFPTGDLGRLDERGRLFITGRLKLLIDVGGMKVNPFEVETVLSQHPQVGECVVVPIRQSETVSRLVAVVTPRQAGHQPTIESLRSFAKSRLSAYKVPRVFEVRASLPHSPTGKILRNEVEVSQ